MKKIILTIFLGFSIILTYSQSCSGANQLTLLGKKNGGIYNQLQSTSFWDSGSSPLQDQICLAAWTCNGAGIPVCNWRDISRWKLSQIPTGAYIVSANLYLYAKTNSTLGLVGSPTLGPNNDVSISRVTTPWDTDGIGLGWGNQHPTTTKNHRVLPAHARR